MIQITKAPQPVHQLLSESSNLSHTVQIRHTIFDLPHLLSSTASLLQHQKLTSKSMLRNTDTMNFMRFPADFRVRIYNEIMQLTDRPELEDTGIARRQHKIMDYKIIDPPPSTPASLRNFSAFLASCKLIYREFEHEPLKSVRTFLHNKLQTMWLDVAPGLALTLPTPARLCDTVNMKIGIPIAYYSTPKAFSDKHHHTILLHTLLDTISSFTLYP